MPNWATVVRKSWFQGDRRTRYVYDLRGGIIRKDTADGLTIRMDHDALHRTRKITGPLDDYGVVRYQYQQFYDFAGNVGRIEEDYPSFFSKLDDRTIINTYDMLDRLTVGQIAQSLHNPYITSTLSSINALKIINHYLYENRRFARDEARRY